MARTKKTLEQRIEKYLSEWAEFLGLSQTWDITFQVIDEIDEDATDMATVADIHVHLPYQRANICISRKYMENNDQAVERSVLHELAHIILMPTLRFLSTMVAESVVNTVRDEYQESVADTVTRALLRMKYGDSLPTVRMDKS